MGYGDELMAAGEAMALARETGRPVTIVDRKMRARMNRLWQHNPHITTPYRRGGACVVNGFGARPYIDYEKSTRERWVFKQYTPTPASIFFTPRERELAHKAAGRLILNPTLKANAPPGKAWPMHKWSMLAKILGERFNLLAFTSGLREGELLDVPKVRTKCIRDACAVLSGARGIITHEGGLHHAAAAVGVPAVVIFGGYISPETTGYDNHVNLFSGDDRTIGWRVKNNLCSLAMEMITVHEVVEHARVAFPDKAA